MLLSCINIFPPPSQNGHHASYRNDRPRLLRIVGDSSVQLLEVQSDPRTWNVLRKTSLELVFDAWLTHRAGHSYFSGLARSVHHEEAFTHAHTCLDAVHLQVINIFNPVHLNVGGPSPKSITLPTALSTPLDIPNNLQ